MSTLSTLLVHPANFRQAILVDVGGEALPLAQTMDDWQAQDFEAMDAGWMRVAGRLPADHEGPVCRRGWYERPRGHSKTTDIAVSVVWCLLAASRRVSGIAAAADRDQAKLLRDAIDKLCDLNAWLRDHLDVQAYRVVNKHTKSALEILSADARSSYGQTPDFIVCDEVTHWPDEALWTSVYSSVAKRADCLLVVITNAGTGMGSSWQWRIRETVAEHPNWYFHRLDGPKASWITEATLAEQRALLPGPSYRRLWLNEWLTEAGDAIPEDYIAAAIDTRLAAHGQAQAGFTYTVGCDLGWSKDSSAVAIVGKHHKTHRFHLADLKVWTPGRGRAVKLSDVEEYLIDAWRRFRFRKGLMDNMQAVKILQDIEATHPLIKLEGFTFAPTNWHKLATTLLQCFQDGLVSIYSAPALISELRRTSVIENTRGNIKLHHPRIEGSHGDAMVAFCLALYAAQELNGHWPGVGRPIGIPAVRGRDQMFAEIRAAKRIPPNPNKGRSGIF